MPIQLTQENYYSNQSNIDYMSVSQFKDFAGTTAVFPCEETAYKRMKGVITEVKSTPLLVGSYVDSFFEGTLDAFKEENPEIFKKTGDKGLKSEFVQAEDIIQRILADDLMASYINLGQKQVIMTADLFGIPWKIKMDSYHPDNKIVDLKVMKDMKPIWSPRLKEKTDFVHYYGYEIQGAIYQKVVELNTGKRLPFYLAVATKEKPSDIEIIEITQDYLDEAMKFVADNIEHVINVKNDIVKPTNCGTCFYCRLSKTLSSPIPLKDIMLKHYSDYDTGGDEDAPEHGYSLF